MEYHGNVLMEVLQNILNNMQYIHSSIKSGLSLKFQGKFDYESIQCCRFQFAPKINTSNSLFASNNQIEPGAKLDYAPKQCFCLPPK